MLAVLTAILGFLGPFLPEVLKLINRRQDNAHELRMFELQMKSAEQAHLQAMSQIEAQADAAEAIYIHKPATSFGVQILDAAKDSGLKGWAIVPTFWAFAFLDFFSGMVRPVLTYAAFGFYAFYKIARFQMMQSASAADFTVYEGVVNLWGDQDWAIVTLVLSYWFGHRAAKAAFGGNATAGKGG